MKASVFRRAAALLLALLFLACLFPSCKRGEGGDTEPDTTAAATEAAVPTFKLSAAWYIIRPDVKNDFEVAALQLLNRAVNAVYGDFPRVNTDFKRPDQELKPNEYEILIGRTNRPESIEITDACGAEDAVYRVVSEHVIVITAGSQRGILTAAKNFARDLLGYEEDEEKNVLRAGTACEIPVGATATAMVEMPSVRLNGTLMREYVLVADKVSTVVEEFNSRISNLCGTKLKTVTRAEYQGGPAFFFGCADTASGHFDLPSDGYTYYLAVSGNKIQLDFKSASIGSAVMKCFWADYLPEEATRDIALNIPDGSGSHVAVPGEVNGLHEVSRTEEKLAAGITYAEILYRDRDGAPVRGYALVVAPGAGTFYAGTPNDSFVQQNKVVQNVMKEINAAVANGKKVVAGVNSGFFDMGGTGASRGLVVKDGTLYAANTERPFFAQMKDGSVKILYATEYKTYQNQIQNAVAGCAVLLHLGRVDQINPGTEMAYTRHPRTAVGITEDGTVVILVVDGRQAKISNGASYGDLVEIFRSFGCTEALNLDGGGSTTFIRKTGEGKYVTENSPSDGALRSVQDSLFVLLPQ